MARSGPLLTEAQWKKIAPLLPKPPKHRKGGRPWIENRRVLEGILWILRSGARWQDLPEEISASFDLLAAAAGLGGAGHLVESLARVSKRIERTPAVKVERIVPGRELCSREKRGCGVGKTKRGKGTKWMVVVDGRGLPLGDYLHSASPAEVRLAETTLATIRVRRCHRAGRPRQKPMRVIADKAYDSDPLRKRLARRGIRIDRAASRRIAIDRRRRMAEHCGATDVAGSSNAPTPGSETSAAWWCATTARSRSIARSFISPAS